MKTKTSITIKKGSLYVTYYAGRKKCIVKATGKQVKPGVFSGKCISDESTFQQAGTEADNWDLSSFKLLKK